MSRSKCGDEGSNATEGEIDLSWTWQWCHSAKLCQPDAWLLRDPGPKNGKAPWNHQQNGEKTRPQNIHFVTPFASARDLGMTLLGGHFLRVTFKHDPTSLFPHCHFPSFDRHLIIKHLIISTNAFCRNIKARMLINQKPNFLFRHIIRDLGKREYALWLEGLRAASSCGTWFARIMRSQRSAQRGTGKTTWNSAVLWLSPGRVLPELMDSCNV